MNHATQLVVKEQLKSKCLVQFISTSSNIWFKICPLTLSNNNHDRATVHRTRSSGIIVVGYYRRLFPSASVKTLGYSMLICTFQFKYVMFGWQVAFLSWSPQTIVDRESASSSESCNKIERANNLSIDSMITGKKRSIEIKMKMCESQSLRSHIFRGRVFTKRQKTSLPGSSLFLSR